MDVPKLENTLPGRLTFGFQNKSWKISPRLFILIIKTGIWRQGMVDNNVLNCDIFLKIKNNFNIKLPEYVQSWCIKNVQKVLIEIVIFYAVAMYLWTFKKKKETYRIWAIQCRLIFILKFRMLSLSALILILMMKINIGILKHWNY